MSPHAASETRARGRGSRPAAGRPRPRDTAPKPAITGEGEGTPGSVTTLAALPRAFYLRPVCEVARDLLGARLVRVLRGGRVIIGRIVEVEAYDGSEDLACHAARGRTRRTDPMFGARGHAYVYFIYGMHHCLNVVAGPADHPAAVLIRAAEPLEGVEWMDAGRSPRRLIASGPGRLTRAFHVDLSLNRHDLCSAEALFIAGGERIPRRLIASGPRIGVEYAGRWAAKPWRYGVRAHPALSKPFPIRMV